MTVRIEIIVINDEPDAKGHIKKEAKVFYDGYAWLNMNKSARKEIFNDTICHMIEEVSR
jgi:hypothetical protein